MTKTDPATLPQYEGKPVPWVSRWTGEVVHEVPEIVPGGPGGVTWRYPSGNELREASGLLWIKEGINRSGTPLFADVNTYRQRAAITKTKCQVCGAKIDARPVLWLMPTAEANLIEENGTLKTTSPPTCEGCIPLALDLCPALSRMGWTVLKVLEYEAWGVFGNVVAARVEDGQIKVQTLPPMDVSYENAKLLTQTVGRQQIVRLTKFTVQETGGGKKS